MFIDSHCHLDNSRFDTDRDQVLMRARDAGVDAIVMPAVTAATWPRLRHVAESRQGLFAAYGLHPMFISEHQPGDLEKLSAWIAQEHPIAVGECGLDFFIKDLDTGTQIEYFLAQLELARDFGLPVIVHARRALNDTMKYLRRYPGLRGVIHSFSGSLQQAEQLFSMGFCIGLGGPLTYDRAKRLRKVATYLPIEAILIETDAPDQPGSSHRGSRNEPAYLNEVATTLATLRDTDLQTIARLTSDNTRELFALPAEFRAFSSIGAT